MTLVLSLIQDSGAIRDFPSLNPKPQYLKNLRLKVGLCVGRIILIIDICTLYSRKYFQPIQTKDYNQNYTVFLQQLLCSTLQEKQQF